MDIKYSILQYGSSVRGTNDKYSDKDLLIVTDKSSDFKLLQKLYNEKEWSISFYTYNKLSYLSGKGFLFVKHIQKEGVIIRDDHNKLSLILNNFNEVLNYHEELRKTELFFNFIKHIPENEQSYNWLCDVLYVNLRNHLIYKSALSKDYLFSYVDLISEMYNNSQINREEYNLLMNLRVLKSCYRNNLNDIKPSIFYIKSVLTIFNKLELNISFKFVKDVDILLSNNINSIKNPYQKLRMIELMYINLGIENSEMKRYITNPQMYANARGLDKVIMKFNKLLEDSKNKLRANNKHLIKEFI